MTFEHGKSIPVKRLYDVTNDSFVMLNKMAVLRSDKYNIKTRLENIYY